MEASEPLVSVIIPTYNWSGALRFAIESVLWQTLRNFELLVIGDGCTDDSEQVTASFGDPRIRWHNLPENTGNQPAPINKGTEMARGRYIAYLGHDDLWLPDHLERLSHALEKTGGDVTYGWIELIGPEPVQIRVLCGVTASGDYEPGTSLVPTCIMHRRAMVADIGPWKDYRRVTSPPDQEFVERALKARKKFVPVKRLTALKFPATWRPNSYLDKPIGQQREYSRRIRENPDFATDELHDLTEFLIRKYPGEMARNAVARNTKAGQLIHSAREIRGLVEKPLDGDP
jgi:glycosyltransferase involved in cell wall biosynthesis